MAVGPSLGPTAGGYLADSKTAQVHENARTPGAEAEVAPTVQVPDRERVRVQLGRVRWASGTRVGDLEVTQKNKTATHKAGPATPNASLSGEGPDGRRPAGEQSVSTHGSTETIRAGRRQTDRGSRHRTECPGPGDSTRIRGKKTRGADLCPDPAGARPGTDTDGRDQVRVGRPTRGRGCRRGRCVSAASGRRHSTPPRGRLGQAPSHSDGAWESPWVSPGSLCA